MRCLTPRGQILPFAGHAEATRTLGTKPGFRERPGFVFSACERVMNCKDRKLVDSVVESRPARRTNQRAFPNSRSVSF